MIFHILTAVLFILKVLDMIAISWWLVVTPSLVVFAFAIIAFVTALVFVNATTK